MSALFKPIRLISLIVILGTMPCSAGDPARYDDILEVVTEFTYEMGDNEAKGKARALTLFGAKIKAVSLAAKYLTHKGLLEHFGKKQNEVFCLATKEIESSIINEKFNRAENFYYLKIKSEVTSIDFIKAQNRDAELERKESGFSYSMEMEQPLSEDIDPGEELSRAYRYIRKKQWRISIIYLHHLEKKYPRWGEVFLAEAVAYYGTDNIDKMVEALDKACSLNNQEACKELQSFSTNPNN